MVCLLNFWLLFTDYMWYLLLVFVFRASLICFNFPDYDDVVYDSSRHVRDDSWSSSLPDFNWSFRIYVVPGDGILSLICFNFPDYDGSFFHGFFYLILVFASSRHACRCCLWFVLSCLIFVSSWFLLMTYDSSRHDLLYPLMVYDSSRHVRDDCWWYMIRLVLVYDSSCHVWYSSHHDSYWWHMIRLVMIYYTLWWYRICVVMFEMTLGDIWFVSSWLWYMRLWVSIVLMYAGFVLCTCAHVYCIKCYVFSFILCVYISCRVYMLSKERRREPSLMTLWTWLFH